MELVKLGKDNGIPTSEHFLLPYVLLVVKYKLLHKEELEAGQQFTCSYCRYTQCCLTVGDGEKCTSETPWLLSEAFGQLSYCSLARAWLRVRPTGGKNDFFKLLPRNCTLCMALCFFLYQKNVN